MFMLRNVSKYIFGDTSKESVIAITQGQLYLVRPLSPKGYSELIFRDAAATIRRTGQQFQYQLVVQRVYEEGEEELAAEGEEGDSALATLSSDKDEKTFLLDESLQLRTDIREGGEHVFAWRDLSGDPGDLYEFICDSSAQDSLIRDFDVVARQCQFERKYRKGADTATEGDLAEFLFTDQPTPDPAVTPIREFNPFYGQGVLETTTPRVPTMARSTPTVKEPATPPSKGKTIAPVARKLPEGLETMVQEKAELHLFDFDSGTFILQDPNITVTVLDFGSWKYWLHIASDTQDWLGQEVQDDLNPVFNFEFLSFIFNHYSDDGSAYSWLLRFKDQKILSKFQEGIMQALWEHLNQTKWAKINTDDRDYVMDAFNDLTMEDAPDEQEEDEADEDEDEEEDVKADDEASEHYDSDESQDDTDVKGRTKEANSQLAVGYKHDRSFVVRGSKIGVFKHTPDNRLKFSTNISKVQTPKGKTFSPKKVMLHAEDSNMILQNVGDPNSLYRMDLEYGKVVDEWKVDDNIPITNFAPERKYAQMTGEQTFLGHSHNALFRVDPRLAGNKLVDSELKQYTSKNDFSAAATTEQGYIAVASNKGDIRMFDRFGINAKTALPVLGDPIKGIEVSADGRWLLATTKTYLLLIDALQKDGKNAGKLGFEKSFAKDSKPTPRRLALTPAHVAQFQHETKAPVDFTPAKFNTGIDTNETTIVTATGPFIITWSMKKVLKGQRDPYHIKRYEDVVKADDFKFGSDKNMIVALPNEVDMVRKAELKRPTRESISGIGSPRMSGGVLRTPARRSNLRNEIVDSPY